MQRPDDAKDAEALRTLFTGDTKQDAIKLRRFVHETQVWINDELGCQKLGSVLAGLLTFAIQATTDPSAGREVIAAAKARIDKINTDANAAMLRTYNKDFAYMQGLFDQVLDMDSSDDDG